MKILDINKIITGIYPYGSSNDLFMPTLQRKFFSNEFCYFMNKLLKKEPN